MGLVETGGGAPDDVGDGFSGANGEDKFLLDAGDGGVEDGFGFVAKRCQGVIPQVLVVKTGFLLV